MDASAFCGPPPEILQPTRPRGRPSDYTQEIAELICGRIADRWPLRDICDDPSMPRRWTVYRWLAERDDFMRAYAIAKACAAEDIFDEILDIADSTAKPYKLPEDGYGLVDPDVSANIRIAARFKEAAKLAPRKYGDVIDPPPAPPPALPPPEDAKVVETPERHPQCESLVAWRKAAKGTP